MSDMATELPEGQDSLEGSPDSTAGEKTVPAERFNGLQRKLTEILAERDALKARVEGQPEAREETMPEEVTDRVQQTLEAQQALLEELYRERWQAKAVTAHPEAAPFADLLVGPDEKSVMDLAQDIASRIKGGQPAAEAAAEATAEEAEPVSETPPTPVPGGSPGVEGLQGPTESEQLAAARERARRSPADPRAWDEFLNMKMELANQGNPLARYEATVAQPGVGET